MKKVMLLLLLLPVLTHAQIITTIAGNGSNVFSGDGGPATAAHTPQTFGGAFDGSGNYYFVEEAGAPRIRKITPLGIITTVVGNGIYGYSGDGFPATAAAIKNSFFDVDAVGNIYIADMNNYRVRKVDVSTGIINTIAGNGTATSTGDGGPASAATITPIDLCVDGYGNLFVSDEAGSIRKISTTGTINTLVSGSALGMCLDRFGNLYAGGNLWVFKIDTVTGHKDTIGGTGIATYNGDEIPATTANFKVYDLAIDPIGNLYVATYSGQRIRKIDTSGIIHTIAGDGTGAYLGDGGAATAAEIFDPEGVAVDVCGNVYVADLGNNRIRMVTQPPIIITPSISITGTTIAATGSTVTVNATVSSAGSSYDIHWMNHGIEFTTTTVPIVTYTKGTGTDTITARIVPTGYGCWDSTTSAGHVVSVGGSSEYLQTLTLRGGVSVYPNPAHDEVNVTAANKITGIIITNLLGQQMCAMQYRSTSVQVDMRGMPVGVYFMKVTDEDGLETVARVVKNN